MPKQKIALDPAKRLALSASTIYIAAGLSIVLGLIAYILKFKFLLSLGFGILNVAIGIILLVLGFLAQRRSVFAIILAALIFSLESVIVLFLGAIILLSAFGAATSLNAIAVTLQDQALLIGVMTGWLVLSINWVILMLKGIGAIKKLKQGTPAATS